MASKTYSAHRFELARQVRNWLYLVRMKHLTLAGHGLSRRAADPDEPRTSHVPDWRVPAAESGIDFPLL